MDFGVFYIFDFHKRSTHFLSTCTCQAFPAQVCCARALARRVHGDESRDSLSPAGRTSLGEGAGARGSLRAVPTSAQAGSPGVWPSGGDLERN